MNFFFQYELRIKGTDNVWEYLFTFRRLEGLRFKNNKKTKPRNYLTHILFLTDYSYFFADSDGNDNYFPRECPYSFFIYLFLGRSFYFRYLEKGCVILCF